MAIVSEQVAGIKPLRSGHPIKPLRSSHCDQAIAIKPLRSATRSGRCDQTARSSQPVRSLRSGRQIKPTGQAVAIRPPDRATRSGRCDQTARSSQPVRPLRSGRQIEPPDQAAPIESVARKATVTMPTSDPTADSRAAPAAGHPFLRGSWLPSGQDKRGGPRSCGCVIVSPSIALTNGSHRLLPPVAPTGCSLGRLNPPARPSGPLSGPAPHAHDHAVPLPAR
jgi:hypothetical protein